MSNDDKAGQRRSRMLAAVTPRGSGGISTMERILQLREASVESAVDWDMWRSMATVELWDAIVLSVGGNPLGRPPQNSSSDLTKEYEKRLRVADTHRGPGGTLALVRGVGPSQQPRVHLPDFATWALSLGWALPDQFPRPAAQAEPTHTVVPAGRLPKTEAPEVATPTADDTWQALAQAEAKRIIQQDASHGFYPPQQNIADRIAADFRSRKPPIVGADGKPLSGATIKRHALKGIDSSVKKAQSTKMGRGKWSNPNEGQPLPQET